MEEVVTMDMETIVLITSLISFTMTTALSIAILALCFAYCKVNVQRNRPQDCCSSKENLRFEGLEQGQVEANLCHQQLQSDHPHVALDAQHRVVNPVTTGNSLPCHFTNMRSVSSVSSGLRNDSGYEDTFSYPNNLSRYSSGNKNGLSTRRPFTSSTTSCRDGCYYPGEDIEPYSIVNIVPNSLPVPNCYSDINAQMNKSHLPILAPVHGSAFPGKTQLHYISEVLDIDNMNISQ